MPEKEGPEERSPSRDESVEEGRTESLRPPAGTGPVPDSWGGASPEASAEDRTTWFERSGRVPPMGEDSGEVEVGPRRFGPFVIVEELGRGGMGTVYLARQEEPVARKVALKLIDRPLLDEPTLRRFQAERAALARLSHPNIAQLYEAGSDRAGVPYFAMELVEGPPITRYCDEAQLTVRARLGLFQAICRGVTYAHQKGILHRDLKPSNLLVSEHDGRPVPKIIDFGIAKALDRPLIERTLAVGLDLLGTPSYMSPEAMESGEKVDTRSDVYGLGVVLYELIVGARPLERRTGESVLSLVRRISVEEPPQPIRRWRALAPEDREGIAAARQRSVAGMERLLESDLGIVIMKALARDPERRYGSVRELEADLGRFLDDQPIQARPPTAGYLLKKLMVRHRGAVVAVTVAALALVLGSIGTTLGFLRARVAQRQALAEARAAVEAREQTDEINEFLTGIFQASAVNSQGADRPPQEITALELLESGAERVETELEEQPAVAARMLMTLGEVYRQLGLYDRALELLEAAGERAEKSEAPASLRASIPREKAQILLRLGRYPESRAELDRALELGERIEDEEERKAFLSTAFDHSGRLARKAGDFEKAERDQKEAVRLRWEAREISWTDLISSEANLGIVYFDQGQWREAEAQFRKTLELCREHLPPGHTTTGHLLNNLAAALGNQSRNDDARPLLEESLAIQRRMLGDEHPAIASILNNLGFMSYDLRDLEAAERFHREALEIRRKTLGGEHPATAWSVDNLSRVRADLGDLDEALDLQTEALRIRQLSLGAGHPEIARSHEYLAELARRQNRDLDALEELDQAIEVRTASLGEDDPSLVPTLIDRAEVLTDLGRSDEARTELDRALTLAPEATTDPQAQKDRQHALQLLAKLDGGDR